MSDLVPCVIIEDTNNTAIDVKDLKDLDVVKRSGVFVLLVSKKIKRFGIFLNVSMIVVLLLSLQSKSESFTHSHK